MADDPKKRGAADRARVSLQDHELRLLAKKYSVSSQQVVGAKRAVGDRRKDVERYLRDLKK